MIPMFAVIQIPQWTFFRLWLPLFLVWIILLPLVLLVLPFFLIACLVMRVNPLKTLSVFWEMLAAIKGTHIEVNEKSKTFLIDIR